LGVKFNRRILLFPLAYLIPFAHMSEALPKITVVTISYNQAQFLEQTILSVIGQTYPNLEYILIDGGSDDGSIAIIEKYKEHFSYWQSARDNGQSSAINTGFYHATGDVLCWLNSDDLFMPGTLLKIGEIFKDIRKPTIIFGNCIHFYENSAKTRGSDVVGNYQKYKLELTNYMIQPSCFWTKSTWQKVGNVNESYHFTMDWDWFIRAKQESVDFISVPDYLSLYRIHDAHKSGSGNDKRRKEIATLYRTYNNEKISKAFEKFDRYAAKSSFFHKVTYFSNHYNFTIVKRLLHFLFFSSISFSEYENITPR